MGYAIPHPILSASSRYMIDTLGFEKHMRQVRKRRGSKIPQSWYRRPYFYSLKIEKEKMRLNGESIRFPSFVEKKDYEFEIVGMHLEPIKTSSLQEAIAHVRENMLFCIMNDASCRDFQADDMALPLSVAASKGIADKSFGSSWALGKHLPIDGNGVFYFGMSLSVNGSERCKTTFDSIYFFDPETGEKKNWSFAEVIAWMGKMNQGFEKYDLLGSGTVGNGCIAENEDHPWLTSGDVVEMRADGLGELINAVKVFKAPHPRIK